MKCADARTDLLTADPAELNGMGDSPLAEHIRRCERCRAAARIILDEQAALAAALEDAARPARTADEMADVVLGAVAGQDTSAGSGSEKADPTGEGSARVVPLDGSRRRTGRRVMNWRVWAPAAAAAALAAVLLAQPRRDWQVPAPAGVPAPTQVAVSAPPGKNVVVFGTHNPDIKVVWFYGSEN